ncbi:hypothetical protein C2G38_2083830 [Gigaspora rosea]|uniref:Uncharacterized protein n=1 Tax=Gigaspora rosea TaxID=44941 RepID=A0A397V9K4_9GLOM|nr:hypothetical protein C2G38_2083830 [Gigaspora rosea]
MIRFYHFIKFSLIPLVTLFSNFIQWLNLKIIHSCLVVHLITYLSNISVIGGVRLSLHMKISIFALRF